MHAPSGIFALVKPCSVQRWLNWILLIQNSHLSHVWFGWIYSISCVGESGFAMIGRALLALMFTLVLLLTEINMNASAQSFSWTLHWNENFFLFCFNLLFFFVSQKNHVWLMTVNKLNLLVLENKIVNHCSLSQHHGLSYRTWRVANNEQK